MSVHIEPIVLTVRWYAEDDGYQRKLPFIAVATLQLLPPATAYISAMQGRVDRKGWKEMEQWLRTQGVKKLLCMRKGKLKQYLIEDSGNRMVWG